MHHIEDIATFNRNNDFPIIHDDREYKRNLLPSLTNNNNNFDGNKSTRSTSNKSSPFYKNKIEGSMSENKENMLFAQKTPTPLTKNFNIDMEDNRSISSSNSRILNPISKYYYNRKKIEMVALRKKV